MYSSVSDKRERMYRQGNELEVHFFRLISTGVDIGLVRGGNLGRVRKEHA